MKKISKGSILLWSMFLSLFISFSFLYISNKIKDSINKTTQINSLNDLSYNLKNNNFENINLGDNESIIIGHTNSYTGSFIKPNQKIFGFFKNNTGSLKIINGGPILYNIYSGNILKDSGIININNLFYVNSGSKIFLENIGGYTSFNFNFENSGGIIFPENYYSIIKNIGGTEIIKETIKY